MNNYYSSNPTFYVGIDCIIFGFSEGEISLLLLKRNFERAILVFVNIPPRPKLDLVV